MNDHIQSGARSEGSLCGPLSQEDDSPTLGQSLELLRIVGPIKLVALFSAIPVISPHWDRVRWLMYDSACGT